MLWDLFFTFAKIGAVTFGGGYAMLPILQREIVEKKGWCTMDDLADYYAIGQCTPGIIAVNTGTFIGQKQAGFWGGIAATLGVVFPSIVIITIIASAITAFADNVYVAHAFAGIRVAVCILIFNSVLKLSKSSVKDKKTFAIFAVILILAVLTSISTVWFVLSAGVAGILIKALEGRTTK